MIFADYKKACEEKKFGKLGISTDLLRKVKNTHEKTINRVKISNGWSSWVQTRSGVQQGRISSPILFNVTMNEICNKIREKNK
jgi:hypothetical protein